MKLALQWLAHRFDRPTGRTQPKQTTSGDRAQPSLMKWVEQASQFIVERLVADAEPHVWYTCDADGRLWWHAHDPVTGRSLNHVSEAEMRAWIEQRYTATLAN